MVYTVEFHVPSKVDSVPKQNLFSYDTPGIPAVPAAPVGPYGPIGPVSPIGPY